MVVEVNALAASLLDSELRLMEEKSGVPQDDSVENPLVATWSFAPEKGNVIFASALDCWGFGIAKFAAIWAKKLNINKNVLQKYMFDNYGYNPSTKKITQLTINEDSALKPIFVVMVLEPLWQIYDVGVIQNNPEKAAKMAKRGVSWIRCYVSYVFSWTSIFFLEISMSVILAPPYNASCGSGCR